MNKTYELSYTAEHIDELLGKVDEGTVYQDASTEKHGLMSATDKAKLDALPTGQQIGTSLNAKVDKVEGKGLSKNDYTDEDKASVASAYHKPQNGIPKTDFASDVQTSLGKADTALQSETDPTVPSWAKQQNKPSYNYNEIGNTPDLSQFVTKTVNDLTNYYLKSETYTKAEVAALIGAIQQFHYEIYAALPQSGEGNVLYLIGPTGTGSDRYEEYVYSNNAFNKIGDTSIDLSGYVTTSNLTSLLLGKADKVTNATSGNFAGLDANGNLTDSGSKASDFATASQGAKADTAYQKPLSGIPSTDLASEVQTSLGKADTAVQQVTVGTTTTGAAGTNASVINNGTSTVPVLDFTIPRGADGTDGQDAYQPFKGTFSSGQDLQDAYPNPNVGDTAYVEATVNGNDVLEVWDVVSGAWNNTHRTADSPQFASGENLSSVNIDNTHLSSYPVSGSLAKAEDIVEQISLSSSFEPLEGQEYTWWFRDSGDRTNWHKYNDRKVRLIPVEPSKSYEIIVSNPNATTTMMQLATWAPPTESRLAKQDIATPDDWDASRTTVGPIGAHPSPYVLTPLQAANYIYFVCESNGNSFGVIVREYTKINEEVLRQQQEIEELSSLIPKNFSLQLVGNDSIADYKDTPLSKKRLYKISLDSDSYLVSNTGVNTNVIFGIFNTKPSPVVQYVRVTKENAFLLKRDYYVYSDDDIILRVAARANSGIIVNITISDITNDMQQKLYDVHFVESNGIMESMLVKVNRGDIVKYNVNRNSGDAILKAFNRADRSNSYLVDTLSASSSGYTSGEYHVLNDDMFVVVYSEKVTGFNPLFSVWTEGVNADKKITLPEQLIFDTDNKYVVLSPSDNDATEYDNQLINYGQIIPADGMYYLIYQGFGTYHSQSSNILMAYSSDGVNWTRGIPSGIEEPVPGTNVIFNRDNTQYTVNEFVGVEEVVNEFGIAVVDDNENKYRMFCAIRKDNPNTIEGECHYLLKSNDLVHWTAVKKVDLKAHDSFSCVIPYGDKLKVYLRMWDYTKPLTEQRMIGVMWLDIWGNVTVPASGIFGHGLYNPAAVRIGSNRDLLIPCHFHVSSEMIGDNSIETYIIDNGVVKYAPSFNTDNLRDKGMTYYSGWNWGSGLVAIGLNQYFLYSQRSENHGSQTITDTHNQLRLCPVNWITYDSYNQNS